MCWGRSRPRLTKSLLPRLRPQSKLCGRGIGNGPTYMSTALQTTPDIKCTTTNKQHDCNNMTLTSLTARWNRVFVGQALLALNIAGANLYECSKSTSAASRPSVTPSLRATMEDNEGFCDASITYYSEVQDSYRRVSSNNLSAYLLWRGHPRLSSQFGLPSHVCCLLRSTSAKSVFCCAEPY